MPRQRLDRYKIIQAFLGKNKGFHASPQQLKNLLNIETTNTAMAHYIITMKRRGQMVEQDGKYYLPKDVPK